MQHNDNLKSDNENNVEDVIKANEINNITLEKTIEITQEKTPEVKDAIDQLYEKREVIKPKTISILNIIEDEVREDKLEDNNKFVRSEQLSKDFVLEKWKDMLAYFKENEKSNLAITLGINEPILIGEFNIEITLSNTSQIELVNQEKHNILRFLRDKLNNDLIDLQTKVSLSTKDNTPYTNSDKFKQMSQDNKHLEKLRQELGLDPDY